VTVVELSEVSVSVGSTWQDAAEAHKEAISRALTAFLKNMFLFSIFFIRAIISRNI
jgi:hypothetical protein